MKIAVAGCGHIFQVGHGPALELYRKENREVELCACSDPNPVFRAKAFSEYQFSRAYANVEEMMNDETPDAVLLLLPTNCIKDQAIRCLKAGVPVLIEKPPGRNLAEAKELEKAAVDSGCYHQIAFNRRHIPILSAFRETLAGREVRYLDLQFFRYFRQEDCFYETAVHGVDTVSYLACAPYSKLKIRYSPNRVGGDDYYLDGRLKSGAEVHMAFCPQSGVTLERITVTASEYTGELRLPVWGAYDSPGRASFFQNETAYEISRAETDIFFTNGFYHQVKIFLDGIKNGRSPVHTIETCMQSMAVMEALKKKEKEICFES